jgi:hypothetical protein
MEELAREELRERETCLLLSEPGTTFDSPSVCIAYEQGSVTTPAPWPNAEYFHIPYTNTNTNPLSTPSTDTDITAHAYAWHKDA